MSLSRKIREETKLFKALLNLPLRDQIQEASLKDLDVQLIPLLRVLEELLDLAKAHLKGLKLALQEEVEEIHLHQIIIPKLHLEDLQTGKTHLVKEDLHQNNPFSRSGTSKSPFGGSKTTSPFSKSDSKNPFGTGRTVNNVSRTNPFGSGSSNKNPFGTKPSTSTTFNRGASNTDFIKMLEVLSKKNPYGLEKIKKDSSYNLNYGFTGQMNEHTFPLSNQNDIDKPISMKLGFKSTPIDLSRPITGSVDLEKQNKTISDPHWRDEHFLKPRDTLRDRKSFGSISYIDSNKQNNRDLSQPDLKETEEMIRYYTQKKPRLHQNSRIISPDNTTTRNIGVESSLPRN